VEVVTEQAARVVAAGAHRADRLPAVPGAEREGEHRPAAAVVFEERVRAVGRAGPAQVSVGGRLGERGELGFGAGVPGAVLTCGPVLAGVVLVGGRDASQVAAP